MHIHRVCDFRSWVIGSPSKGSPSHRSIPRPPGFNRAVRSQIYVHTPVLIIHIYESHIYHRLKSLCTSRSFEGVVRHRNTANIAEERNIMYSRSTVKITNTSLALLICELMILAAFAGVANTPVVPGDGDDNSDDITRRNVADEANEPPLRMDTPLVYDSESDRVVFFGGAIDTMRHNFSDTWSYDYNTNTWTNMSPSTSPPPSEWHAMAYDSGEDRIVLFGGYIGGSGSGWTNHHETWTYDYNINTWTNMTPSVSPPELAVSSMAYDSE
jgi:hypothetical protein